MKKPAKPIPVQKPPSPHVYAQFAARVINDAFAQADCQRQPGATPAFDVKARERAARYALHRHRDVSEKVMRKYWRAAKSQYVQKRQTSFAGKVGVGRLAEQVFHFCRDRAPLHDHSSRCLDPTPRLSLCLPTIRRELHVPASIRDDELERIVRCLNARQVRRECERTEDDCPLLLRTYWLRQHGSFLREFTNLTPAFFERTEAALKHRNAPAPTIQAFLESLPKTKLQ